MDVVGTFRAKESDGTEHTIEILQDYFEAIGPDGKR